MVWFCYFNLRGKTTYDDLGHRILRGLEGMHYEMDSFSYIIPNALTLKNKDCSEN